MPQSRQPGKLAVILHADIAGSTALVQQDEHLAHERIQDTFHRFGGIINQYHGYVRELRGDALLAEFERASDAVTAALAFQANQVGYTSQLDDNILPIVRAGIALGEVVIADNTITGAGVVLAQRIEQLAEPGGICISSAIREALPARLPFQYGLLGEQKIKGFDEPVRVFNVALGDEAAMPAPEPHLSESSARPTRKLRKSSWIIGGSALSFIVAGLLYWLEPWEPTVEPADPAKMVYALPDKPSVAVLPFENISKVAGQEYFSDGVTEDITTDLSKVSGLFVAAPGSTFAYKGSAVKIRQVAEDLGVRYVLEGSVQRSEDRVRVNAKLIDAVKGDYIWAERFDREIEDVFDIQSEVAQHIAKALAVTIKAGEHERLFLKHTTSIDAYDQFLRARRLVDSPGKDDIRKAEGLFKRAIELDPNFASAYAGLSFNYSVKARFRFSDSPDEDKQHALEFATKAIEIDPELAWAFIALGGAHLANGEPAAAVEAVRQALILQPNSYEANLFIGLYLQFAGESAKAVEHLELAQRLNPVDTVRKLSFLGMAYFMNGNYEKSAAIWKKRMEKFPVANVIGPVFLAGSYAMLDRMEDASATRAALLNMRPGFHLSDWSWPRTYKKSEDFRRLYDAAIKAGIPEYSPLEPSVD
ncbi:MAG: adenylate/guanylate cyclase domain-containing protein [Gammaproteobacteria bacterium]|nr:adenylate/guanylate cyclase domain-containing protein [Gammaproteobacteria bacterium]